MDANSLTAQLKEHAFSQGVDLIGITSARPFVRKGETEATIDPRELLDDARSVIVAAFYAYGIDDAPLADEDHPRGKFPHGDKMGALTPMTDYCSGVIQGFMERRGYEAAADVDYRIPQKPAAARAGLGKYGKNAVILTKEYGAYVRLVTLVTNAPLAYEEHELYESECGECDICLRSCPTAAIYEPYRLHRELCICDWLWGTFIPIHLREKQENRLFGCGLCVDVCPRNQELTPRKEFPARPEEVSAAPELIPLITGSEEYYRKTLPSFPMLAGMDALRGNAIIASGNMGTEKAVDPLCITLTHPTPQIRAYSAWAIGKIGGARAAEALEKALEREENGEVRKEIQCSRTRLGRRRRRLPKSS
jgi:epoxyqueuosine reductase